MKRLTTPLCLSLLVFLGSTGKSVALPACQGNDGSKWQNYEDTLTGSGKVFWGEFRDGEIVGGHADGNKYVGDFWSGTHSG